MTIRPVFFGTVPFCDVCPGKFLTSNGTPFCPVFLRLVPFLPWFPDFEETVKFDASVIKHTHHLVSTKLCRFWFTQISPNCLQNFKNFLRVTSPNPHNWRRRLSRFWLSEIWSPYHDHHVFLHLLSCHPPFFSSLSNVFPMPFCPFSPFHEFRRAIFFRQSKVWRICLPECVWVITQKYFRASPSLTMLPNFTFIYHTIHGHCRTPAIKFLMGSVPINWRL